MDTSKLLVSANAHVIAPYNCTLDKVTERFLGKRKIGTTGRGIGPTYADKINRVGVRVQDLFDESILRQKVEGALEQKNHLLVKVYNRRAITVDEVVDELLSHAARLRADGRRHRAGAEPGARPRRDGAVRGRAGDAARRRPRHLPVRHLVERDGGRRLHRARACRRHGSTASIGIIKAYTTRVGEGPFPTELDDASGEFLRTTGGEFGTTTGPPPPLRLVRRRHRPLRPAGQRPHRHGPHEARRALGPGDGARVRRVRRRRRASRRDARVARPTSTTRSRSTRSCPGWTRGHLRRPHLRRPAGRAPRATCSRSRR